MSVVNERDVSCERREFERGLFAELLAGPHSLYERLLLETKPTELAEDAVQTVVTRVLKGGFPEDIATVEKLYYYLFRAARNEARTVMKTKKRHRRHQADVVEKVDARKERARERAIAESIVEEAKQHISPENRESWDLKNEENKTLREMAEERRTSIAAEHRKVNKAKAELASVIRDFHEA